MNPVMRFMVRRGAGGRGVDLLRVLRVRGRTTGRLYEVPVRVTILDEQRYIMTMLGDAEWARNLRVAGGGELILGASVEQVAAYELHGVDKTTFLTRCSTYPQFESRARATLKFAFDHPTKQLNQTDIALLAQVWYVFRLDVIDPPENNFR